MFAYVKAAAVAATNNNTILNLIEADYGVRYSLDLFTSRYTDAERQAVSVYRVEESAPAPSVDPDFEQLAQSAPVFNVGPDNVTFDWLVIERDLDQSRRILERRIGVQWGQVRDQGVNGNAPPTDVKVWDTTRDGLVLIFEANQSYLAGVKAPNDRAVLRVMLAPDDVFIDRVGDRTIFDSVFIPVLEMHDAADDRAFDLGKDVKLAADRAELEAVRDEIPNGWPAPPVFS